ncbi:hypothetical protein Sjap_023780 [Stephania japonica]|uniref:Uncharacterized protein n=1 Tax=Stephania japonica TaxID=461633 RepID=A0AAP0EHI2_9MAGN
MEQIGERIGTVVESDLGYVNEGIAQKKFMRIKVEIPLLRPLMRELCLELDDDNHEEVVCSAKATDRKVEIRRATEVAAALIYGHPDDPRTGGGELVCRVGDAGFEDPYGLVITNDDRTTQYDASHSPVRALPQPTAFAVPHSSRGGCSYSPRSLPSHYTMRSLSTANQIFVNAQDAMETDPVTSQKKKLKIQHESLTKQVVVADLNRHRLSP